MRAGSSALVASSPKPGVGGPDGVAVLPEAWRRVEQIQTPRQILLVMPRFPTTFWGLDYSFRDLISGPRYPLPPLSLLTLAAFLPRTWDLRLVDENVRPVSDADLAWCDVVMLNAMIVQAASVRALTARAHRLDKVVAIGGPNPTISPEQYPEADYIHRGELGDATVKFLLRLAERKERPLQQEIYAVLEKIPLQTYPAPRYDLIRASDYLSLSLQFAVGCPFNVDLKALQKSQNARRPLLESIRILQSYGLEIWAGLILGLDTDRPETAGRMVAFVEEAAITMAMVNLLNAPTGTQLWRRLKAEGRLLEDRLPVGDNVTDTNMVYRQGQAEVMRGFREVWARLYEPAACLRRVRRNLERTTANSARLGRLIPWQVKLRSMPKLLWHMGVRAPYRAAFWKLLVWSWRRGALDAFNFQMGMLYHCFHFREQVLERLDRVGSLTPAPKPALPNALARELPASALRA